MPTNDDPLVITVDWNAVEDELDRTIPAEQRYEIEQTGNTSHSLREPDPLFIERYTSFHHPNRGPLDPQHIPFDSTSYLVAAFKQALGAPSGLRETINQDEEMFFSSISDLYDAAVALTKRGSGWYDGRHPIVAADGFRSQTVGTMYVRLAHTNLSAIEQLPIDDLPIELGTIVQWDTASNEHYTAIYHHKDFPALSLLNNPIRVSEYANDIGLIDIYEAPVRFTHVPTSDYDYMSTEPSGFLTTGDVRHPLPPTATNVSLYRQMDSTARNFQCVYEWVEWRDADSLARSLAGHGFLFEGRIDETAIEAATLLDRHQLSESVGDRFGPPPYYRSVRKPPLYRRDPRIQCIPTTDSDSDDILDSRI